MKHGRVAPANSYFKQALYARAIRIEKEKNFVVLFLFSYLMSSTFDHRRLGARTTAKLLAVILLTSLNSATIETNLIKYL